MEKHVFCNPVLIICWEQITLRWKQKDDGSSLVVAWPLDLVASLRPLCVTHLLHTLMCLTCPHNSNPLNKQTKRCAWGMARGLQDMRASWEETVLPWFFVTWLPAVFWSRRHTACLLCAVHSLCTLPYATQARGGVTIDTLSLKTVILAALRVFTFPKYFFLF